MSANNFIFLVMTKLVKNSAKVLYFPPCIYEDIPNNQTPELCEKESNKKRVCILFQIGASHD